MLEQKRGNVLCGARDGTGILLKIFETYQITVLYYRIVSRIVIILLYIKDGLNWFWFGMFWFSSNLGLFLNWNQISLEFYKTNNYAGLKIYWYLVQMNCLISDCLSNGIFGKVKNSTCAFLVGLELTIKYIFCFCIANFCLEKQKIVLEKQKIVRRKQKIVLKKQK